MRDQRETETERARENERDKEREGREGEDERQTVEEKKEKGGEREENRSGERREAMGREREASAEPGRDVLIQEEARNQGRWKERGREKKGRARETWTSRKEREGVAGAGAARTGQSRRTGLGTGETPAGGALSPGVGRVGAGSTAHLSQADFGSLFPSRRLSPLTCQMGMLRAPGCLDWEVSERGLVLWAWYGVSAGRLWLSL